ncbi:MAG TPA: hypothetical protein VGN34_18890 [Ktedonobacteraceae bacterium]|jgi:DNA-directed RNA polymerase specialized sigma24 family protein
MSLVDVRFGGLFRMPFTAHDLRYHPEQSYPLLYAYLHRNAQRYLGSLQYDAFEVDIVVGHVVEQLVRLGLFAGGDSSPKTALDQLSDAQFYAFLNRSVHNKAIDRLRKKHIQISTSAELESSERDESDDGPMGDAVTSLWGSTPFSTPEEITIHLSSQLALRDVLKHCIQQLQAAPNQLQAVLHELSEYGADDLLQVLAEDWHLSLSSDPLNPHNSQHKDHAHKKIRHCLQQKSSNLTVIVALRLCEYKVLSHETHEYTVDLQTLAQNDLSEQDVQVGLKELVAEGLLSWHGEESVHLSSAQIKRLTRYYKEE